jgi:hypothetical protein
MSPQASEELRARWHDGGTDAAMAYLEQRGFRLGSRWEWRRQTPPNEDEQSAIDYLHFEWDFGGWRRGG